MAARKNPGSGKKVDKIWSDALRRAVNRYGKDGTGKKTKYLDIMANKTVKEGAGGNMAAVAEVGNRLDGKPVAAVEMSGGFDGVIEIIHINLDDDPPMIDVTPKPKAVEDRKAKKS